MIKQTGPCSSTAKVDAIGPAEMTAIYRITKDGWTAQQEMKKYDFEDSFFYPRSLKKVVYYYYEQFTLQNRSGTHAAILAHIVS